MTDGKPGDQPPSRPDHKARRAPSHPPARPGPKAKSPSARAIRRPPGFIPRATAVRVIATVVSGGRALDDALEAAFAIPAAQTMEPRDRAFTRLLVVTVLRRWGELDAVVRTFIAKPLPEKQGLLWPVLLAGAAQVLCLETPPHAAISLAVEQARADEGARRFDKLVNAVLRKVATLGPAVLSGLDGPRLNTPDWMWTRWVAAYGEETARAIAAANLNEAALDVSVKSDATGWAERLGGIVLTTGSVRLKARGRIEDLPGYAEGEWWVQDAAAALPGRLLGDIAGKTVADLCAAPGGKTAELAAAGAKVTAVELVPARIARIRENLARLNLNAEVVAADATTWEPGRLFDAVLLDAPCTATGTIRRHPDILRLKQAGDLARLAATQDHLLTAAAKLVRPGGTLVYCTCSLEPEEGIDLVRRFLTDHPAFTRQPVRAAEIGGLDAAITADGDVRTLPTHMQLDSPEMSGLDGFYAARLHRRA